VTVEFRDASGTLLNAFSSTPAATGSWVRSGMVCQGVAGAAVEARLILGVASGTVEYDDVQFEQTAATSPFSDAPHLAFVRSGELSHASGHRVWTVEMGRGLVRLLDSGGVESDDLGATNGRFFELAPGYAGRQHIAFAAPTGGTLDVELLYTARHL